MTRYPRPDMMQTEERQDWAVGPSPSLTCHREAAERTPCTRPDPTSLRRRDVPPIQLAHGVALHPVPQVLIALRISQSLLLQARRTQQTLQMSSTHGRT
jgi:hypothetical protein